MFTIGGAVAFFLFNAGVPAITAFCFGAVAFLLAYFLLPDEVTALIDVAAFAIVVLFFCVLVPFLAFLHGPG